MSCPKLAVAVATVLAFLIVPATLAESTNRTDSAESNTEANTEAKTEAMLSPEASPNSAAWKQLSDKEYKFTPVTKVQKFGDGIVVFGDEEVKTFDPQSGTLKPLNIAEIDDIVWVGEDETTHDLYALGKRLQHNGKKKVFLVKKDSPEKQTSTDSNSWHDIALPDAPDAVKGQHPKLLVGDGQLLFVTSERCSQLKDGKWITVKLQKGCISGDEKNTLITRAGKIYSGFNLGDGGYVNVIDIASGAFKRIFSSKAQGVVDLDFGPDGKLWITCGYENAGHEQAGLYSYNTKTGTLKCHCLVAGSSDSTEVTRNNWKLEPTAFQATTFLRDGSALVVTRDFGLMKLGEDDKWTRITTEWQPLVSHI